MVRFVIWDVQHGHAVYVKTETKHVVFDLGTGSYGQSCKDFSPLLHLKNKYGVEKLDALVVTHPHGDHLYDIVNIHKVSPRVFRRPNHLAEEEIKSGNTSADEQYIDKYLAINKGYSDPVGESDNPFNESNNGGVNFISFTPKSCARSNLNNHSIVTVVSHAGSKIIIPGDNEAASWNELLENSAFREAIKDADILLASHHGRESGYSSELVELISPYLTIVSDGAETETSAVDYYSKKSKGWQVFKRDGSSEERKCLTTRNDGVIVIEFGKNTAGRPYLNVKID